MSAAHADPCPGCERCRRAPVSAARARFGLTSYRPGLPNRVRFVAIDGGGALLAVVDRRPARGAEVSR